MNKNSILKPFSSILEQPDTYNKLYLPSVPHDDDYEVYQNFNKINNENLKFYQCKNGHFYTIGECRKAATTSVCMTCKTPIGGQGYKLEDGNKEVTGKP